jgi:hypothetical protein
MIAAVASSCTGEHAASASIPGPCLLTSIHSSTIGGSPLPPDVDATKKSASTAGGVTLLGGRGPFHAFSRNAGLDIRSPVGEEDIGRRPTSRKEDLGGEEDLALDTDDLVTADFFSQALDSVVGKPILVQQ